MPVISALLVTLPASDKHGVALLIVLYKLIPSLLSLLSLMSFKTILAAACFYTLTFSSHSFQTIQKIVTMELS